MPKAWLKARKRDHYYQKSKEENYRSRAAYKLLQAARKYHFLNRGDVVVDLGAAPGGWLQITRKFVGVPGFVLGIDLRRIQPFQEANVKAIVGDIRNPNITSYAQKVLPSLAEVVLSDVSPNVSGVWEVDHARQIHLAQKSLMFALEVLRVKGSFFTKVFQGDMFNDFLKEVNQHFERVEIIKPRASRSKSAEVFLLALGLKDDVRIIK